MLTVLTGLAIGVLAVIGSALMAVSGVEKERGNTYKAEGRVGLCLIFLAIAMAGAL